MKKLIPILLCLTLIVLPMAALGQARGALDLSSPRLAEFRWTKPNLGPRSGYWSGFRLSDGAHVSVRATYTTTRPQMLRESNPNALSDLRHDPTFHKRSTYTHRKIGDAYWVNIQLGEVDIRVRNGLDVYHGSMGKIRRLKPGEHGPTMFPITTKDVATVEDLILAAIKEKSRARP